MGIHKPSPVSMAAVIMLFLAIFAYLGTGIYEKVKLGCETRVLRFVNLSDSLELSGIAVRREQLVCSPGLYGDFPPEGSRLKKGSLELEIFGEDSPLLSESGIYFSDIDGFEYLRPEDIEGLSPSGLKKLLDEKPRKSKNALGRITQGWDWYYAALCRDNPALRPFSQCELSFEGIKDPVKGRIVSISAPENGEIALVIRLSEGGKDLLSLRKLRAQLIISDYSGIEIPAEALHRDREGNEFVYTLTAGKTEKKAVEIIYKASGQLVAAEKNSADAVKAGDRVLLSEKN